MILQSQTLPNSPAQAWVTLHGGHSHPWPMLASNTPKKAWPSSCLPTKTFKKSTGCDNSPLPPHLQSLAWLICFIKGTN